MISVIASVFFRKNPLPICLLALLLLLILPAKGQEGNIFLKHYQNFPEGIDNQNFSIALGADGLMYLANTKGILVYDGHKWELIKTPSPVHCLFTDPTTGKLLAGCRNDFGYLGPDASGKVNYISVSPGKAVEQISKIIVLRNYIYYYSPQHIYVVESSTGVTEREYVCKREYPYAGIFTDGKEVYVNVGGKGLHVMKGNNILPVNTLLPLKEEQLLFGLPYDAQHTLIGLNSGKLFLFRDTSLTPYLPEAHLYLSSNLLSDGILLNDEALCFSTLSGGCVIIDKPSGKTLHVINYQSGLPDDEIFAINLDKEGAIWMAHEYGLTRADKTLPFRSFSLYPGLEGNILDMHVADSTIYVATSEGVFFLTKVKNFEEVIKLTRKTAEKRERKRGFFARLFRKKEINVPAVASPAETKTAVVFDNAEKTYALHSVSYVFKKVEGINDKCRQIVPAGDRLIVAGNTGLYEVSLYAGSTILKDMYIHTLFYSPEKQMLYAAIKDGISSLVFDGRKWAPAGFLSLGMDIVSLFQDKQTLWVGGNGKVAQIRVDEKGGILFKREYLLPDTYMQNLYVRRIKGRLSVIAASGIFCFNSSEDLFVRDSSLSFLAEEMGTSQASSLWIKTSAGWTYLPADAGESEALVPELAYLRNIKGIYHDSDKNIWIIDRRNNLLRLNKSGEPDAKFPFVLMLRKISDDKGNVLSPQNLLLDYNNNSVSFYFAAPWYKNESEVQYQYKLGGLEQEWSSWVNTGSWHFPYLPSGDYQMQVRARNAHGQITNTVTIPFKIDFPYWKTSWFYSAEIVFFILLIGLCVFLNRQNSKGMFWAKFATFMTLIIIIELIHNMIQSYINLNNSDSPVLTVASDIILALMISPIEKGLEFFISKRRKHRRRILRIYRRSLQRKVQKAEVEI